MQHGFGHVIKNLKGQWDLLIEQFGHVSESELQKREQEIMQRSTQEVARYFGNQSDRYRVQITPEKNGQGLDVIFVEDKKAGSMLYISIAHDDTGKRIGQRGVVHIHAIYPEGLPGPALARHDDDFDGAEKFIRAFHTFTQNGPGNEGTPKQALTAG